MSRAGPASADRAWIAAHIPHAGTMCLLDAVLAWDAHTIHCRATSHHDPANPLRAGGRLGAACGVEYAAQAMAVHAALLDGDQAGAGVRGGRLVSVRALELPVAALDAVTGVLDIRAARLAADARTALYSFELSAAGELCVLRGRASVVLDAGRLPEPLS